MKKIEVNTKSKCYSVYFGNNTFAKLNSLIDIHNLYKNIFIVVDENVYKYHTEKIDLFISRINNRVYIYTFHANEINKSLSQVYDIYSALIENGFSRDTLIIGLGGGITGDIAGYVASTFVRGVKLVHVPTTLLAMVDSSVGGKTGVNFESTKNIIGTFYQPDFVLIDTEFLKTLPKEEIVCGFGEVLKYSFLIGHDFLNKVRDSVNKKLKFDKKLLVQFIETCVKLKASIVEKDEKEESGLRKVLNLGHTFAHAIEIERGYTIKHGHAVILGLTCSLYLSKKLGLLKEKHFQEYLSILLRTREHIKLSFFYPMKIYEIMKRDKKTSDDKIKFVLVKDAGNILVDVDASSDMIIDSINEGLNHFLTK